MIEKTLFVEDCLQQYLDLIYTCSIAAVRTARKDAVPCTSERS